MRVLHVIASANPNGGGPIEGIIRSAEAWAKHGHERQILTLDPPDAEWLVDFPVTIFALGSRTTPWLRKIIPWARYGFNIKFVLWLRKYAENYDAVIINGIWNFASFGGWIALRKARTPYYVFPHGMLDPIFAGPSLKGNAKKLFWKLIERRVLRDARRVLYTCDEEMKLAATAYRPYVARPVVVGYGARRPPPFSQSFVDSFFKALPEAQGRRLVLFLSRIHPKKGVDNLLKSFARLADIYPDYDLVIAGPGDTKWLAHLMQITKDLKISGRVHWPGMLRGSEKYGAYYSSEIFILPSHQENFGIAVAEALSFGKIVVITNKINIWREIYTDGAAIIVDDALEAVERGLRLALDLTENERESMSARATKCFETRFDMEKNALDLLRIIDSSINDRREPSAT